MRLLIDTHVFLWAASEPENITIEVRSALEDPMNDIYVSAAVAWEIGIKYAKGNLQLPLEPSLFVASRIKELRLRGLPITQDHALAAAALPAIHADPFDRIMIAQAQVEGMTFATRDARSLRYPVLTLPA